VFSFNLTKHLRYVSRWHYSRKDTVRISFTSTVMRHTGAKLPMHVTLETTAWRL